MNANLIKEAAALIVSNKPTTYGELLPAHRIVQEAAAAGYSFKSPTHKSEYEIPPYSFETNATLAQMLERDEDSDEVLFEIADRKARGEWMTWAEQKAAILAVNPAAVLA